jgi:lactoylglutathione lyase
MKFSFVTFYVRDLKKITGFYQKAFGLQTQLVHESGLYVEMKTGETVLAFSQTELAQSIVKQPYRASSLKQKPVNFQIAFEPQDIQTALAVALQCGGVLVSDYEVKPWGWESALLRDPEGNLIELARKRQQQVFNRCAPDD